MPGGDLPIMNGPGRGRDRNSALSRIGTINQYAPPAMQGGQGGVMPFAGGYGGMGGFGGYGGNPYMGGFGGFGMGMGMPSVMNWYGQYGGGNPYIQQQPQPQPQQPDPAPPPGMGQEPAPPPGYANPYGPVDAHQLMNYFSSNRGAAGTYARGGMWGGGMFGGLGGGSLGGFGPLASNMLRR